uniref:Uncharacterized protein n=2 Tax=Caenorhabditis japonica TaxID=281687 RepID=A0A8R1IB64_CAEJA
MLDFGLIADNLQNSYCEEYVQNTRPHLCDSLECQLQKMYQLCCVKNDYCTPWYGESLRYFQVLVIFLVILIACNSFSFFKTLVENYEIVASRSLAKEKMKSRRIQESDHCK